MSTICLVDDIVKFNIQLQSLREYVFWVCFWVNCYAYLRLNIETVDTISSWNDLIDRTIVNSCSLAIFITPVRCCRFNLIISLCQSRPDFRHQNNHSKVTTIIDAKETQTHAESSNMMGHRRWLHWLEAIDDRVRCVQSMRNWKEKRAGKYFYCRQSSKTAWSPRS